MQVSNGKTIVEIGAEELHRVTIDESARKAVDSQFNEARGREAARLHVQLYAVTEADRRATENARATLESIERLAADLQERTQRLSHLIESFEQTADKRFNGVTETVNSGADSIRTQVDNFWKGETQHFESLRQQVGAFQTALSTQTEQASVRATQDLRSVRDELVRMIDQHANQSDAAFAALRGDLEVVKFLVMDLIKDRIGRADPKAKPI